MAKFEITTYPEMIALHRTIMEAKFHENPIHPEIMASIPVAKIANELVEIIIQAETENGDEQSRHKWTKWRKIDPTRREWALAVQHVQEYGSNYWKDLSREEKKYYIHLLLSPLEIDDELIDTFVSEVEN